MARPVSDKIRSALDRLVEHASQLRPGERFLSNRAIARQYDVSYQTADRLLCQLEQRGLLLRRRGAGSFVPGEASKLTGVQLMFHARARRRDSFGGRLLALLRTRLERDGVDVRVTFVDADPGRRCALPRRERFPVIWELPQLVDAIAERGGPALLLNNRPAPGLAAVRIDSVSVDDRSGGAAAAQLLLRASTGQRFAMLAGPAGDPRSDVRVAGFLSLAKASVVHCPTWFADDAIKKLAPRTLRLGPDGIFCCNDRLAQAVISAARAVSQPLPPLVGFDDAPIAARLNLTTIAIPWTELVEGAARIIRARLRGDASNASRQVFAVSPVIRGSTMR